MALILIVAFLPSALNMARLLSGEDGNGIWAYRAVFFAIECALVFVVMRMLVAWNDGRPIYMLLCAACLSLLFATKETAFITIGVLLLACLSTWLWRMIRRKIGPATETPESDDELTLHSFMTATGSSPDRLLLASACAVLFIYLWILFFSSFFTNWEGIRASLEAYSLWTRTGSKDHTQNGTWAYLTWGMKIESPVFLLAAIGSVAALIWARNRFAVFAAFWSGGILAAYTLIPYKTPWLAISIILPMCLVAGYGLNELLRARSATIRVGAVLLAGAAATVASYQSYQLSFVRYDDDTMPYVYAHTRRDLLNLIERISYYAEKSGKNADAEIQVVSPDYWPMVWYLKDYNHANFHGRLVDADNAEMIIAKKNEQDEEIIRRFSANYLYCGTYQLRPGVDLVLLVRRDLADSDAKEIYRVKGY
jgi:uncharacterized protein (TIGR03663 family)